MGIAYGKNDAEIRWYPPPLLGRSRSAASLELANLRFAYARESYLVIVHCSFFSSRRPFSIQYGAPVVGLQGKVPTYFGEDPVNVPDVKIFFFNTFLDQVRS